MTTVAAKVGPRKSTTESTSNCTARVMAALQRVKGGLQNRDRTHNTIAATPRVARSMTATDLITHVEQRKGNRATDLPTLLIAALIFAALSLWGAITSSGFLEADSCTHYL